METDSQQRDFTYVDDVARGTVAALRPLSYEIINLGSDRSVALNDALRHIEALTEKRADVRHEEMNPADAKASWANIDKAKRLLDWEPQVRLADGLARLVEWYMANREWARHVHTGATRGGGGGGGGLTDPARPPLPRRSCGVRAGNLRSGGFG